MNYGQQFRRQDLAETLADRLAGEVDPDRSYSFMEVCGAHTRAILQFGIQGMMPDNVQFLRGPGCPICVLPPQRIADLVDLSRRDGMIVCAYRDVVRTVEPKRRGLFRSKPKSGDIRLVGSVQEALQIARDNPRSEVVFLRHRVRDRDCPDRRSGAQGKVRGAEEFQRVLQSPADPGGDPLSSGVGRHRRARYPHGRRLPGAGPCQRRHR